MVIGADPIRVFSRSRLTDGSSRRARLPGREVRLWDPTTGARVRTFTFDDATVESVSFSSDGTRLAIATNFQRSGASDASGAQVRIYDPKTGELVHTLQAARKQGTTLNAIHWGPKGRAIISVDEGGDVAVWNVSSDDPPETLIQHGAYGSSVLSADGNLLMTARSTIKIWDLRTRALVREIVGDGSKIAQLRVNRRGTVVAAVRGDRVDLYRVADGAHLTILGSNQWESEKSIMIYADNGTFTGDAPAFKLLRVRDAANPMDPRRLSPEEMQALARPSLALDFMAGCPVSGVGAVSVRGSLFWHCVLVAAISSCGHGTRTRGPNAATSARAASSAPIAGDRALATDASVVAFSGTAIAFNDASRGAFAIGKSDGSIEIHAGGGVATMAPAAGGASANAGAGAITALAWRGDSFASVSADGTLRVWDLRARKVTGVIETDAAAIAWDPAGRLLAAATSAGTRVYDGATLDLRVVSWGTKPTALAWRADGRTLAVGDARGGVTLLDAPRGRTLAVLEVDHKAVKQSGPVAHVDWTPDGTSILSADESGAVRLWDAVHRTLSRDVRMGSGRAHANAFLCGDNILFGTRQARRSTSRSRAMKATRKKTHSHSTAGRWLPPATGALPSLRAMERSRCTTPRAHPTPRSRPTRYRRWIPAASSKRARARTGRVESTISRGAPTRSSWRPRRWTFSMRSKCGTSRGTSRS